MIISEHKVCSTVFIKKKKNTKEMNSRKDWLLFQGLPSRRSTGARILLRGLVGGGIENCSHLFGNSFSGSRTGVSSFEKNESSIGCI